MRDGKRDKGQWGHKPVRKWEHRSTREKKKEKAARYSEPLLGMINQLHWAELTSRGPVCKFSSCHNNPLQTHTHPHTTHRDNSCASCVPFNYSYGKISDLFQPVAHFTFCSWKTEKLSYLCWFVMLQKSKHVCSQTVSFPAVEDRFRFSTRSNITMQ